MSQSNPLMCVCGSGDVLYFASDDSRGKRCRVAVTYHVKSMASEPMSSGLAIILVTALYKLSCLTVGCLFCSLGYRLFKAGIWGNAGDMETKFKDVNIVLKSAAPGTFFAVL